MRIPEKALSWTEIIKTKSKDVLDISFNKSLNEIIKKANTEYIYWEKFKYKDFPNGIKAEDAWGYIKMTRNVSRKITHVSDKDGIFFGYWLPDIVLKDLSLIDKKAVGEILAVT